MEKFADCIWLWGQEPGSHHASGVYKLPGVNKMDSMAGCQFFGIDHCFRVATAVGPEPPFDAENEKLKELKEVVWSAVGAGGVRRNNEGLGDLPEVLRQAELYPNVSGAVLDDFFTSVEGFETGLCKVARHPVENVEKMRELLHHFPLRKLNLWLVLYTYQQYFPIEEYLPLFDKITLWTWHGKELKNWRKNLEILKKDAPAISRYAGCYMWDYGDAKPLPVELMKFQLDEYLRSWQMYDIDGIVLCSNCIADLGIEAVNFTKEFIAEYGQSTRKKR